MTNFNINHSNCLADAYKDAFLFTKSHYENFPVVSIFIPAQLRKHIAIIYQFARQADDIADEGNLSKEKRLQKLEEYGNLLTSSLNGEPGNIFWEALLNTIHTKELNPEYFYALLKAFKQDVVKHRYENYNELLGYCNNSANPVGRLVLELYSIRENSSLVKSDYICTALQLVNFYQDVNIDYSKGRIYLPIDEMKKYGFTENHLELKLNNDNFKMLIRFQLERVGILFEKGIELIYDLPKPLNFQIYWIILSGKKMIQKIKNIDYNTLNIRPKLTKLDRINLLLKSLSVKNKKWKTNQER
ncbi:squalene synthase HpnC [Bacteroidota bacterium]